MQCALPVLRCCVTNPFLLVREPFCGLGPCAAAFWGAAEAGVRRPCASARPPSMPCALGGQRSPLGRAWCWSRDVLVLGPGPLGLLQCHNVPFGRLSWAACVACSLCAGSWLASTWRPVCKITGRHSNRLPLSFEACPAKATTGGAQSAGCVYKLQGPLPGQRLLWET